MEGGWRMTNAGREMIMWERSCVCEGVREAERWTDRIQERENRWMRQEGWREGGSPQRHGGEGLTDSSAADGLPQQLSAASPVCG